MMQPRSIQALKGVHPDLVRVIERADANGVRFVVVCGRRSIAEQKVLVAQGKSKTMHSRHITGHAVDLVDEHFTWSEHAMRDIADGVKKAAAEVGVPIEWGGDWKSFIDTPHFQLPQAQYPDSDTESHLTEVSQVSEKIHNFDKVAIAVPAVKPLVKSRTLWNMGIGGSFLTWLGGLFATGMHWLTEAGAQFAQLAPARDMLATIGGNSSAIAWGLGVGCLISAACVNIGDKTPAPPQEDAA